MIERKGHSQIEMIEMFEKSINFQHGSDCCYLDNICDKKLIKMLNSVKWGQYPSQRCKITAETPKKGYASPRNASSGPKKGSNATNRQQTPQNHTKHENIRPNCHYEP